MNMRARATGTPAATQRSQNPDTISISDVPARPAWVSHADNSAKTASFMPPLYSHAVWFWHQAELAARLRGCPLSVGRAPLQAKQAVVKSGLKLPAVRANREYFEFDAYAEAARMVLLSIDQVMAHKTGESTTYLGNGLQRWYDAFAAGREAFKRDELYRTRKTLRKDLTESWTDREITRRVVAEKVSLLVGSFPNAAPPNAETYMGMMVEEIIAANPT